MHAKFATVWCYPSTAVFNRANLDVLGSLYIMDLGGLLCEGFWYISYKLFGIALSLACAWLRWPLLLRAQQQIRAAKNK